jgi:hypothetical protein
MGCGWNSFLSREELAFSLLWFMLTYVSFGLFLAFLLVVCVMVLAINFYWIFVSCFLYKSRPFLYEKKSFTFLIYNLSFLGGVCKMVVGWNELPLLKGNIGTCQILPLLKWNLNTYQIIPFHKVKERKEIKDKRSSTRKTNFKMVPYKFCKYRC